MNTLRKISTVSVTLSFPPPVVIVSGGKTSRYREVHVLLRGWGDDVLGVVIEDRVCSRRELRGECAVWGVFVSFYAFGIREGGLLGVMAAYCFERRFLKARNECVQEFSNDCDMECVEEIRW